jgi:hypothetical protein
MVSIPFVHHETLNGLGRWEYLSKERERSKFYWIPWISQQSLLLPKTQHTLVTT